MGSGPDKALYKKSTNFCNKTVTIFLHNKVSQTFLSRDDSEVNLCRQFGKGFVSVSEEL